MTIYHRHSLTNRHNEHYYQIREDGSYDILGTMPALRMIQENGLVVVKRRNTEDGFHIATFSKPA